MREITVKDVPFMANDPVFLKLAEISDYSTMSREDRLKYDNDIRIMRDNLATYSFAIETGIARGQTEGRAEGRAEGFAKGQSEGFAKGQTEGRAEGQRQEKLANARRMKAKGLSVDLIMEITGLSQEEVEKL